MSSFDFITDEDLRISLERDFAEVNSCIQSKAWKAVHVLGGSIIEAVLLDFLQTTNYASTGKKDLLKMELHDLVEACKSEKLLSAKTVQLSAAVQSYRNLIHPGRMIRLNESVDQSGAEVVRALVDIVVTEVSAKKKDKYGYTAEQLVGKIERDASSLAISNHLLNKMAEGERCRLLMKVIPDRYFELANDPLGFEEERETQGRLSQCFRTAFDGASEDTRKKVTSKFAEIVRTEAEGVVFAYETAFFKAYDLRFLPQTDILLVKDHLVSRMRAKGMSLPLVSAIEGLGQFLAKGDVAEAADSLIKFAVFDKSGPLRKAVRSAIVNIWGDLPGNLPASLVTRLDDWIAHFEKRDSQEQAQIVKDIKSECDIFF